VAIAKRFEINSYFNNARGETRKFIHRISSGESCTTAALIVEIKVM
jgi:hypothetical protein